MISRNDNICKVIGCIVTKWIICSFVLSAKSWIGMFDEAPFAISFDSSIRIDGDAAVLYVELLEKATRSGNGNQTLIRNRLARLQAKLSQLRAFFRQKL